MIEYKQSTVARVPVKILDQAGNPATGVLVGTITLTVIKSDGSVANVSPTSWTEITTGAYLNQGVYSLQIPASATNLTGQFLYAVSSSSNKVYHGALKIVANEEVDTFTRIGLPLTASVSGDIAAVQTKLGIPLTTVSGDIGSVITLTTAIDATTFRNQLLREGRSKIFTGGPDANRQVDYAPDGSTVIQKWDLKDDTGAPSTTNIFERVPVLPIP